MGTHTDRSKFVRYTTSDGFEYYITNIVLLGYPEPPVEKIDLTRVKCGNEYRKLNRFPAVYFKFEEVSVILFKNGKMIITGIESADKIGALTEGLNRFLKKCGLNFDTLRFEIKNMVAISELKRGINLEKLALYAENCIYEPEQFPAAIIRLYEYNAIFLVFSNSKVVCLGTDNKSDLEAAISKMGKLLMRFIGPNIPGKTENEREKGRYGNETPENEKPETVQYIGELTNIG